MRLACLLGCPRSRAVLLFLAENSVLSGSSSPLPCAVLPDPRRHLLPRALSTAVPNAKRSAFSPRTHAAGPGTCRPPFLSSFQGAGLTNAHVKVCFFPHRQTCHPRESEPPHPPTARTRPLRSLRQPGCPPGFPWKPGGPAALRTRPTSARIAFSGNSRAGVASARCTDSLYNSIRGQAKTFTKNPPQAREGNQPQRAQRTQR